MKVLKENRSSYCKTAEARLTIKMAPSIISRMREQNACVLPFVSCAKKSVKMNFFARAVKSLLQREKDVTMD